jgi:hypothetical protein
MSVVEQLRRNRQKNHRIWGEEAKIFQLWWLRNKHKKLHNKKTKVITNDTGTQRDQANKRCEIGGGAYTRTKPTRYNNTIWSSNYFSECKN